MDHTYAGMEILNSWKEIAQYLQRGTRTVQRWEHDLGLPVRRPRGKSRSAVLALRQELDLWLGSRPQASCGDGNGAALGTISPAAPALIQESIKVSRELRSRARELRREISLELLSLVSKLELIHQTNNHDDAAVAVTPLMAAPWPSPDRGSRIGNPLAHQAGERASS